MTYFRKGASIYLRDKDGERAIMFFEEKEGKGGH
jgi:hypothetical protein